MSCGQYTESSAGRIRVVTSGTRPTGVDRYVGQRIFESDTGRELLYDGSGWVIMSEPEQPWAPTFASGVTVGNGAWSLTGTHRHDGRIDIAGTFTLGSTSAITGSIVLNLPVAAARAPEARDISGMAAIGGGFYDLSGGGGNTSAVTLFALSASGSYVFIAGTSNTVPAAWGTGSAFTVRGSYPMASRYS